MTRAPRLKVYTTPAGFFDALVAAPSQKAALAAWGAKGDLFALGEATVVDDPALAAEALARPGEIVRRPRGDTAALLKTALEAKPPQNADATSGAKPKPEPKARHKRKPKPAPPPDRSKLDAAQAAVKAAEADLSAKLARIQAARDELAAREGKIKQAGRRRLAELGRRADAAQAAYDEAARDPD